MKITVGSEERRAFRQNVQVFLKKSCSGECPERCGKYNVCAGYVLYHLVTECEKQIVDSLTHAHF